MKKLFLCLLAILPLFALAQQPPDRIRTAVTPNQNPFKNNVSIHDANLTADSNLFIPNGIDTVGAVRGAKDLGVMIYFNQRDTTLYLHWQHQWWHIQGMKYVHGIGVIISGNVIKVDTAYLSGLYYKVTNPSGYITGNQPITLSSEASGSGTTSIPVTLNNAAVIAKLLTGFTPASGTVAATDNILQAFQKVVGNISLLTGSVNFKGVWNASTNTPTLTSSVGTAGDLYLVSVAGSTTLDGISSWSVFDAAVFNGSVWQKIGSIPVDVLSVFGRVGNVVLLSSDVTGALGFTPENVANKATTFGTLNNTLYPTTQAVANYITSLSYLTTSAAASTYVPLTRTINGLDLSVNRTITANTPNAITFNNSGAGVASGTTFNGGIARIISWNTIGAQQALTLTTTGTGGPSTLVAGVLNIPQYSGGGGGGIATIGVTTANGVSAVSSGGANPRLTFTLGNITPTQVGTATAAQINFLTGVTSNIQTQINGKQNILGFTPENVANKAINFGTLNNVLYPSVQATETEIIHQIDLNTVYFSGKFINPGTISAPIDIKRDSIITSCTGCTFSNATGALVVTGGGGIGTVTSVSAGTGMSFTTITASGAVKADTTVLQTVLNFFPKGDTRYAKIGGGTLTNTLTFGTGLVSGTFNNSTSVTEKVDTTVMQTIANFFPKGDTRYAKITSLPVGANPTASAGATAVNGSATTFMRSDGAPKVDSTVFQTVLNFFPKGDTRYLKSSVVSGLANPTATIGFTAVNGSAITGIRSDGAPKADSTVIRSVANSYSLSGMQTKLNNYVLSTALLNHIAGYGLSGSNYNTSVSQTWTADTTSSTGLVSKSRLATNLGGYVKTIGVTTANGVSGTSSGGTTPNLTITLGNITPTSISTIIKPTTMAQTPSGTAGTDSVMVKHSDGTIKAISPTYYGTGGGGISTVTDSGTYENPHISGSNINIPNLWPRVWNPLGTVMTPDLVADGNNLQEPCVLYEGSPKILTSATGNVYKMVFTAGGTTQGIYYAESADGNVWTRRATVCIANHARTFLYKEGSTYYIFCVPTSTFGQVDVYSSSDMINWTLAAAAIISKGSGGSWDGNSLANMVVMKDGSTYQMLLSGNNSGASPFTTGYFHSTSITSGWTQYGSNPVLGAVDTFEIGPGYLTKIGSTYYAWVFGNAVDNQLPTDIYRYHSSNLTTWTADNSGNPTYARVQGDEGVGQSAGQVGNPFLVEVSGQTHMFFQADISGTGLAPGSHLKHAIANYTIANLALTNEGNGNAINFFQPQAYSTVASDLNYIPNALNVGNQTIWTPGDMMLGVDASTGNGIRERYIATTTTFNALYPDFLGFYKTGGVANTINTGSGGFNFTSCASCGITFSNASGTQFGNFDNTGLLTTKNGITINGGDYLFSPTTGWGATVNPGTNLQNVSAATSGVPSRWSPAMYQVSTGWTGSASQIIQFYSLLEPVSGTNPITYNYKWRHNINFAGDADVMILNSATGLSLPIIGQKISIATGSNASVGTATLSSGTVTVSTTAVTASSLIILTYNTPSGTLASGLSAPIGSITAGTSFVINSLTTAGVVNTLDNSTVNYFIVN